MPVLNLLHRWLGLPLGTRLVQQGHQVKGSTTSAQKMAVVKSAGIIPYLIKLTEPEPRLSDFLNTDILVIAIPSKQITPFDNLIKKLPSKTKVIYTSSTGVYSPSPEPINEKSAPPFRKYLLELTKTNYYNSKKAGVSILFHPPD